MNRAFGSPGHESTSIAFRSGPILDDRCIRRKWLDRAPHVIQTGLVTERAPILEFDPDPVGVFDPVGPTPDADVPRYAVACHFVDLVNLARHEGEDVISLPSGMPLLRIRHEDHWAGLFYPGQGAPLAAASLERVIAAGCTSVVACGDAGTLIGRSRGDLIIVGAALRDEGTSYHYLPPAREVVAVDRDLVELEEAARSVNWDYTVGKTWTTDGLFRETRGKIARRRDEGCVVVEMEAAALMAVADFREIRFGQYLYVGDDVSGEEWHGRDRLRASTTRQRLLGLSLDAARRLNAAHES